MNNVYIHTRDARKFEVQSMWQSIPFHMHCVGYFTSSRFFEGIWRTRFYMLIQMDDSSSHLKDPSGRYSPRGTSLYPFILGIYRIFSPIRNWFCFIFIRAFTTIRFPLDAHIWKVYVTIRSTIIILRST